MHRRRVVADRITYVGLDVHKEGPSELREYGRIANTPAAVERLARKLGRDG
jgi:hypothetical protein